MVAYQSSLSPSERNPVTPLVDFMCQVARLSGLTCQVVLDAGYLDILMWIFCCGFRDTSATVNQDVFPPDPSLIAACNYSLLVCSGHPQCLRLIMAHPLHVLWPKHDQLFFTSSISPRFTERRGAWIMLGEKMIEWRIYATSEMMVDWMKTHDENYLFDVCFDILEFSG